MRWFCSYSSHIFILKCPIYPNGIIESKKLDSMNLILAVREATEISLSRDLPCECQNFQADCAVRNLSKFQQIKTKAVEIELRSDCEEISIVILA